MKVSELAREADVSVATVKYYLREGLLHAGRLTAATQADYDQTHLDRLRLIRVLRDIGGVPVASIGAVLDVIENSRSSLWDALGVAHDALALHPAPGDGESTTREEIAAYLRAKGWHVRDESPALTAAAEALDVARELWGPTGPELFDPYVDPVDQLADFELAYIDESNGKAETVRQVIVGTVVFERALVALRRLAQQHHSDIRFNR